MTINVAWRFRNRAYLVADSLYRYPGRLPNDAVTSFGQRAVAGIHPDARQEEHPKHVVLGTHAIALIRGDVAAAHAACARLCDDARLSMSVPLDEILMDAVGPAMVDGTSFGVVCARHVAGFSEIVDFDRRRGSVRRLEQVVDEEGREDILIEGALTTVSAPAVLPVAAMLSATESPDRHDSMWTAAAVAGWLQVQAHFEKWFDRAAGGYTLGAVVDEDGIHWMRDLRVVRVPHRPRFGRAPGPGVRPVDGEFDEPNMYTTDIFVRGGVAVVSSSAQQRHSVWAIPGAELGAIDEASIKVSIDAFAPELWTLIASDRRHVAFVTPSREVTPSIHAQGATYWLSPDLVRDLLEQPEEGTIIFRPDIAELLSAADDKL